MIRLTRLNGHVFVLNAEMIQEIEATPDTIVTLTNGQKIMIREPVEEVRQAVVAYKREIFQRLLGV
jgi:flagellar protein FlbD